MDYNKIELNTEVKISEGKFSAVCISYSPTKKLYSWTLYYEENNKLHPVNPLNMSGVVKTWARKSEAINNLKSHLIILNNPTTKGSR